MESVHHASAVLHVLAPARIGGLEQVVRMLATHQRDENAYVAAVLPPGEGTEHPFCRALSEARVPVAVINAGARDYLGEYRQLAAIVDRLRPRVVHTHGYRCDVIGGMVARRHGAASVSTVHGFIGGGRKNRLNERVQCFALRHADAVIGVSGSVVTRLSAAGVRRERLHLVPNGFSVDDARIPCERKAARRALGIPTGERVAVWVGRISHEKGLDVALDGLSRADASWRLSVIGDGPAMLSMKERADALGLGSRVRWHGVVPEAARLLRAFDVLVLSSRTEGTPIVLLEAMHASVPIVATRVGGVPDMLDDGEARLVAPESALAIAEALDEMRRDTPSAVRRARAANRRLHEQFAVASWLTAIRAVYDAAVRPVN